MNNAANVPDRIRVSAGSATVLGLMNCKLDAAPTTAYLMTYRKQKCSANCGFCPQARSSNSRTDMLSRVTWPTYTTNLVINNLCEAFKNGVMERVCIQTLNYPEAFSHLFALVSLIRLRTRMPISVSYQPANTEQIVLLCNAGARRISIPLDAATRSVFDKVKGSSAGGPYHWEKQLELLKHAVRIFGRRNVSTHLIVGIGETEREMVRAIQYCVNGGIVPGLFAFTPVCGTALESNPPPSIGHYRRIQLARHLIVHKISKFSKMRFEKNVVTDYGVDGRILRDVIETGEPFLTSGCPGCNRPFYNERPGGTMYNYPSRLTKEQICQVKKELMQLE